MSTATRYVRWSVTAAHLMMRHSNLTFNGPFKRAELVLLPQYAASDNFLAAGKWTGSKHHILSADCEDVDATVPLYCIVVGTISSSKTYLGKHGNFSTRFTDDAQKAKLQFTLTHPNDPDFGPNFNKAVAAFQEHQRVVSESSLHLHFLLKEEGNAMRMNFNLFDPKVRNSTSNFCDHHLIFLITLTRETAIWFHIVHLLHHFLDEERLKETQQYSVDDQYECYWTAVKAKNYCFCPFRRLWQKVIPVRDRERVTTMGMMTVMTTTMITTDHQHVVALVNKQSQRKWVCLRWTASSRRGSMRSICCLTHQSIATGINWCIFFDLLFRGYCSIS